MCGPFRQLRLVPDKAAKRAEDLTNKVFDYGRKALTPQEKEEYHAFLDFYDEMYHGTPYEKCTIPPLIKHYFV